MESGKQSIFPGLRIIDLVKHEDERGYFLEVLRKSWIKNPLKQASLSLTKPGIIKAFHWHKKQLDIWYVISGKALVVLHDLRPKSGTYRQTKSFVLDAAENPKLVIIPKRIAHGYKVLGSEPLTMLYVMDIEYNPKKPDEERISFDDKSIGFDWETDPA